jgi:NTE family protein
MKRPKIGLALGAGAARGFAHVGVLQTFIENDIPVDYVAGCSMGAFIGAMYATGSDMFFFERLIPQFELRNILDFRIPKHGLIKGEKIKELVRLLTKNKNIEETDIPYRCVAVELTDSKLQVFDKGPISEAVRASISIPGLFVPHEIEGKYYVDGGVLERMPVSVARDMGADIVIGVDVGYKGECQKAPTGMMQVMALSMNIMNWEIARNKIYDADILILPKVRRINAFSSEEAEDCIQLGRAAALEALPEIKKALLTVKKKEEAIDA